MPRPRSILPALRGLAVVLLAAPLAMCAPVPAHVLSAPSPAPVATVASVAPALESAQAASEHVVVISIDGLRPDAIEHAGARNLQRLMREGAYSLEARTILPSRTLPSHTSMLTGVEPSVHGITWNDERVEEMGLVKVPTIFALARQAGFRTAAFFSKPKFQHLMVPGSLDFAQAPQESHWYAGHTAEAVERYLRSERPNLMFVHFGEPDYAGHTMGWMGYVYRWAVRRADGAVGRVLAAADRAFGPGNYTVIVTADHGGHGRTHGTEAREDVTIPWIAWGRGIRPGIELPVGIHTTDTAATALWLLGLDLPAERPGEPVVAGLQAPGDGYVSHTSPRASAGKYLLDKE